MNATLPNPSADKQFRALRGSAWSRIAGHLLIAEAHESRLRAVVDTGNRQDMLTRFHADDMRRHWAIQSRQPGLHESPPRKWRWVGVKGAWSTNSAAQLTTLASETLARRADADTPNGGFKFTRRGAAGERLHSDHYTPLFAALPSVADRYANKAAPKTVGKPADLGWLNADGEDDDYTPECSRCGGCQGCSGCEGCVGSGRGGCSCSVRANSNIPF